MLLSEVKPYNKVKYYHASPKRFKIGKVLVPGLDRGKESSLGWGTSVVYMTNSMLPHFTILKNAYKENWHIYEVQPIGKVWQGLWDDVGAERAEVVKYIGTARGIVNNRIKNKGVLNKLTKLLKSKNIDTKDMPFIGSYIKPKTKIHHHFKW